MAAVGGVRVTAADRVVVRADRAAPEKGVANAIVVVRVG